MNIAFLDAQTMGQVPNFNIFETLGNFTSYPITTTADRISRLQNIDVVITCKVVIDKEVIDACPQLKLICVAATGTNNIDIEYAQSKDIPVKNVSGYSTESVAQMTLGMILNLYNQLTYFDLYVKSGQYTKSDMFTHYGPDFYELKGKQAGIIGLGNIGKRVAQLLEAFGCKIVYYSTSGQNNDNQYNRLELNDLLETSDIVTIHSPLNDNTRNLIGTEQFKRMKPTSILLNAGRGGIVNETALVDALNAKIIAGAGLDVYEREPMLPNHPLLNVKYPQHLVLTPHAAWTSVEARTLLIEKIAENIRNFRAS